jgi:hypothetical protein
LKGILSKLLERRRFTLGSEHSFIAAGFLLSLAYAYFLGKPTFDYFFSSGLPPILAFGAVVFAFWPLYRNRVRADTWLSRAWLGYSLGIFLWFLGESTWGIYVFLLGIATPFPSIADVFWLAGYVPFLFALASQVYLFRDALSAKHWAVVSMFVVGLSALVLALLIPPTLSEGDSLVSVALSVAYPLLDVVLLAIAVLVLLFFAKGVLWGPLRVVMVAIILSTLGDILFAWASVTQSYFQGHPADLLFNLSYIVFGLGFYLKTKQG